MRRFAIFTAGAALVLGSLAIPGMAVASEKNSLDTPITAMGKGHGHGHGHGKSYSKGYRRGYRHGYSRARFGYGYWGYGYGFAYGPGYWPGGYGYGAPGFWPGGFGCNFDYPCGPPYDEQCRSFRGAPAADPACQTQTQPAPGGASAQPAPGAQPAPDAGAAPAPDAGAEPAPTTPAPDQGGTQPRPY